MKLKRKFTKAQAKLNITVIFYKIKVNKFKSV